MTDKTLVQKIAAIMGEIGAFQKTGDNRGMNFKFVEVNEILLRASPLFSKYEVIMYPTAIDVSKIEFGETRNGGVSTHVFLNVTWEVTDGETSIIVASFGEALDTSDKASNKAQTAAEKQALQKLLLLANESDNDANNEQREYYRPAPAPPVNTALENKLDEAGEVIKKLAKQFVLPPKEIIQVMIDDEKIPAAWEQSSAMKTVAEVQEFIDAAKTYLDFDK
jgi:uncharacterized protein YqgV (UPF0045/DUF77 family)